ncbi:MAG: hypothetical protein GDA50_06165 [Alphaproteobacteria bacterium GM202ARS2]|nr:hypothetical protein [Alphaproteobacteria bacterium GM202ARS2]
MKMMKAGMMCVALFALSAMSLVTAPAQAGDRHDHDDMMHDMMHEGSMVPMVEMPRNMSKRDFPKGMIMMMDTPDGKKAFVPWYLTKAFSSTKRMADRDSMDGVMMQMEDGSYAFLPWYLSPQHSDMLMHKKGKMMESDGMRFVVVPWYKQ